MRKTDTQQNKDFNSDIKKQIITKQISDYTKTVRGKLNFE